MSKTSFLKNLAAQISNAAPQHTQALKKDFEKTCQSILNKAFAKFDLVTREEFSTQTKVLLRTRKKVAELEVYLKMLEAVIKNKTRK